MGSTDLSCQNTHSCLSGYGLNFFNMVILSSALLTLFSPEVATGADPFTWSAGGEEGPVEEGGGLGDEEAVVVAIGSLIELNKEN